MDNTSQYHGNSVFRNQPPYTFFNKSFEDANDIFFLQLNEIDNHFLTAEQLQDETGFLQKILLDPRTKKEPTEIEYDIKQMKQKPFMCGGIKSALTKEEHKACLRVMLAQQETKRKIFEKDLIIWRKVQTKLLKERGQMQRFISEFAETHKEEIYAPTKRMNDLYKIWFLKQKELILKMQPNNLTFNTHTGLPHVNMCTVNEDKIVKMVDIEILAKKGKVHVLQETYDWHNLNFRLDDYAEIFYEHEMIKKDTFCMEQINEELESSDKQCCGNSFYIPIEALLFLLTAGDYIDLPTTVLIEIGEHTDGEGKMIVFDKPLPVQNTGWHTHQKVIEQCFAAFLSIKGRAKWLDLENENSSLEHNEQQANDDCGMNLNNQYKPIKFEDFLKDSEHLIRKYSVEEFKHNNALFKYYLKESNSKKGLKLLTNLTLPATLNSEGDQFLACEFIKLENKPQFGCEVMTKYELLRAWLQIKFMSSIDNSTNFGFCYRLSSSNFKLQLKEHLTLENIENSLQQIYQVNISHLLTQLSEFLKLLSNMPIGKYMLRYNLKYKEKLLLCAPSEEITQNTIFLHYLLALEPTNLLFMTQENSLTISDKLCSAVHLDNNILPCAFLPLLPGQRKRQTADTKMRNKQNFINKIAKINVPSKDRKKISKKALMRSKKKKNKKKASKTTQEEIKVDF